MARVSPLRFASFCTVAAVLCCGLGRAPARAARNDLVLRQLCPLQDGHCAWIKRDGQGALVSVQPPDPLAVKERFRTLMSELGAVMAPQILTPATTLGFAGFQVSAEVASTTIANKADHWDAVQGVDPMNVGLSRPSSSLQTVGFFVRKGIWLPLPSMEVGAGVTHLLQSQMLAYQGYAKLALNEGFQDWPLPAVAGRLSLSHLTGANDVRLDSLGLDILLSKGFGVMGTVHLEPFGGWSYLLIKAKSGPIDMTPGCDGYAAQTGIGEPGPQCSAGDLGTGADLKNGIFRFEEQDAIVRHRFFGGFKIHFSAVSLTLQYSRFLAGRSRDSDNTGASVRDGSEAQHQMSLGAGFDF